ncbi:MAG: hypothetical protein II943_00405 [Victivallales bacterium]|nr:hypothetical protein [Victivallales bacterium]
MTMRASDIARYRPLCLELPGGEILDRYTDEQAAAICNGVGAAWTDRVLPRASSILNRALPWAVAPSIVHDLAYHEGKGGDAGRAMADAQFLAGCQLCIEWCSDYPWTRWWRGRKARALYVIVRKFGDSAWEGK